MKIGVADRNIVAKIYCRCLSTFLILDLLHYCLVDLAGPDPTIQKVVNGFSYKFFQVIIKEVESIYLISNDARITIFKINFISFRKQKLFIL